MSFEVTGRRKPTKPKKQARAGKRKRDDVDVEKLQKTVDELVCISRMRAVGDSLTFLTGRHI